MTARGPRLWVLGNLTIDDVVFPDGTTTMGLCGGNAVYAALGARLWEPRVGLAARIGPDFPTRHLAPLRRAGIELSLVDTPDPSIHNWALYESDGARRFLTWLGSGSHIGQSIRPDELPLAAATAARACHIAPMPIAIQRALAAHLAAAPVIAVDPHEEYIAGAESELAALLRLVTLFLPSRREAALLYGRDDPEAAAAAFAASGPKAVAIKLGAEGSLVCAAGGAPRHVPAVPVRAIDPTGCGDAYCGGFVAAYGRGADPVTAACHGTVAASFTVETRGALAVLPLDRALARERLEALLKTISPAAAPRAARPARLAPPTGGPAYAPR